jgi:hypothetical protein
MSSFLLKCVGVLNALLSGGRYQERLEMLEAELREKCTSEGAWVEPKGQHFSFLFKNTATLA